MINLQEMKLTQLQAMAKDLKIKGIWTMTKGELTVKVEGLLNKEEEITEEEIIKELTDRVMATKTKEPIEPTEEIRFYLKDLATAWELTEKSTRRKLRNKGYTRGEGVWSWNQKEFDMIKTLEEEEVK